MLPVDRRLIDLEIARVHDDARRRVNRQRQTVGHAVRDTQELHFTVFDANALARLNRNETIAGIDAMLLEFRTQQRQSQRAAIDRSV